MQSPRITLPPNVTSRNFRILLVVILVILSIQSWFGDFVNIFVAPASGTSPTQFSFSGFLQGINSLNSPFLLWHAFEGIALVILAIAVAVLSFVWSKARSVRICCILALIFLISAAFGGFLFVVSGFSSGGNSMQMGGSFIGTYALYFIALYYAK